MTNKKNTKLWIQLTKEKIYSKQICNLCNFCKNGTEYEEDTIAFKSLKKYVGKLTKCNSLKLKSYLIPRVNYCQYFKKR